MPMDGYFLSFFAVLGLAVSSCASTPYLAPGISKEDLAGLEAKNLETIAIVGLNDFHGSYLPLKSSAKLTRDGTTLTLETGGVATLAAHMKRYREVFGNRFLLLDAGDQWQGSLASELDQGKTMIQLYNHMGVQAATLGNHEFDFGSEILQKRLSEAQFQFLVSNLKDAAGNTLYYPNLGPSGVYELGRVKVGVIGSVTINTPYTAPADVIKDYQVVDPVQPLIKEAAKLREEGAQIIVWLTHGGLECDPQYREEMPYKNKVRKPGDEQGVCRKEDEVVRALKQLPPGTVDAVLSGHTHTVVHHWVNGVPVIQSAAYNRFYTALYLTYDVEANKLLPQLSRIEGPVAVCPKIFAQQGDCLTQEAPAPTGRGELVAPTLLGSPLPAVPEIERVLQQADLETQVARSKKIAVVTQALTHPDDSESSMGNLMADVLRSHYKADVAFVNWSGVRGEFDEGPLTYEELYRALPFQNTGALLTLSGAELQKLVSHAQARPRMLFSFSGVTMKLAPVDPAQPLAPRLRELKMMDGKPINAQKLYRVATMDFLAKGGDALEPVTSRIQRSRVQVFDHDFCREIIQKALQKQGVISTPASRMRIAQ